jgi:dienelactone hydrolase
MTNIFLERSVSLRMAHGLFAHRIPRAALICLLLMQTLGAADTAMAKMVGIPPGPQRTGYINDDLKDVNGAFVMHFAMYVPTQLPKKRELGLIIITHGNNNTCEPHAQSWHETTVQAKLDQDYIVLALKSRAHAFMSQDVVPYEQTLAWVLATYPIDRRRVHAVGFSAGCGFYAVGHQEQFATISMYCSGRTGTPPLGGPDQGPGLYLHYGAADGILPLSVGLGLREKIQADGYRYVCRLPRGVGHEYGPAAGVPLDNLRWMHQSRNRFLPLETEQQEFFKQAMKDAKSAEKVWANSATALQALKLGGHYAQAIALKAFSSKHEQVRVNIAKAAANGLFGAELLMELGKCLKDKSADLRQAAIAALAPAANWNWPEAKQLLVTFALDKKNAVADRCLATQALVDATAILALCEKYEDSVIVPALVRLLDSPDQAVRVIAFTGLSRLSTKDLGYHPALKDRTTALSAWQAWANEQCGYFKDVPLKTAAAGN